MWGNWVWDLGFGIWELGEGGKRLDGGNGA